MPPLVPAAALIVTLGTMAILGPVPVNATQVAVTGPALPMSDILQVMAAKGLDVVRIGRTTDGYSAVLRNAQGRLVEVWVDPETATIKPAPQTDMLRNIVDLPGRG